MWGVVEKRDDEGEFLAYHVVPMVQLDVADEPVMSAAHILSEDCPCHPFLNHGKGGWNIWNHHDEGHTGALSEHEWRAMAHKIELN